MEQITSLAEELKKQLPAELVEILHLVGEISSRLGYRIYLVGGVVRDLFLHRPNLDLDLVVEGDAIRLAEELVKTRDGHLVTHSRFNTARIEWEKWRIDIACARSEDYPEPGALPEIKPCNIHSDLIRRDFSINAMAISLNPTNYGELIDLYHGQEDLKHGIIRVLHDNSFRDDPTRIWRAVRYEQRLNFQIEQHTLDLIKRDIDYLKTVTGDRIRHELELCLTEDRPERILARADQLGLLARLSPPLKADEWVIRKISRTRNLVQPYSPSKELYLAFLVYRLSFEELALLISYLKFPRATSRELQETLQLRDQLHLIDRSPIAPSQIYRCLHPYHQIAILANLLASDSARIKENIELYLNRLRYVHPLTSGEDLKKMDIASGPLIKEILEMLREARLDGKVSTRDDEMRLIISSGKYHH